MGSHKTIRGSFLQIPTPPPPPPTPDYNVTGSLNPDSICNYFYAGLWYGKPYYRRTDSAFEIWFDITVFRWIISTAHGIKLVGYWSKAGDIVGNYLPSGAYSGTANVSTGGH